VLVSSVGWGEVETRGQRGPIEDRSFALQGAGAQTIGLACRGGRKAHDAPRSHVLSTRRAASFER
jgi:hypothetical protein